jgi:hypothetical protein
MLTQEFLKKFAKVIVSKAETKLGLTLRKRFVAMLTLRTFGEYSKMFSSIDAIELEIKSSDTNFGNGRRSSADINDKTFNPVQSNQIREKVFNASGNLNENFIVLNLKTLYLRVISSC